MDDATGTEAMTGGGYYLEGRAITLLSSRDNAAIELAQHAARSRDDDAAFAAKTVSS